VSAQGPLTESGAAPGPRWVAGGIVAHNDEERIGRSIRSLLSQELPEGYAWNRISVVASGCTDRTVEIARELADRDSRLDLVVEPVRRGKAAALHEVLRRSRGESVVLLNSDSIALPGAVAALLRSAESKPAPYAVMARPVVDRDGPGSWPCSVEWMWELHHELHREILAEGTGRHLSDEMFLLSLPAPAPLREGIINDGSFLGVWYARHGGSCWYAPESRVAITTPGTIRDHLVQRRRIHVGNAQVRAMLGTSPTTLPRLFLDDPGKAMRALRSMLHRPRGSRHFARIAFWEVVAHGLALWDRLPPARDHVHWRRISPSPSVPPGPAAAPPGLRGDSEELGRRVGTLLRVASEFRTSLSLDQLHDLLPASAPPTVAEFRAWLAERPHLARIANDRAFAPAAECASNETRARRGEEYRAEARRLLEGPLRIPRRWARCVGVTGSAAYGEPHEGDDLDFFVVTTSGALWAFLAFTYLALRLDRWGRQGRSPPLPCFNYVLDDQEAPRAFSQERGFLVARESLAATILDGDPYYRGLLTQAPWIGQEIPRQYALRTTSPGASTSIRARAGVRLVNAVVFPLLAAYLQLAGLRRNSRPRTPGRSEGSFRTKTGFHLLAFESHRFEELRDRYVARETSPTAASGMAGSSRLPTSR
jgi:poly-beta-1,6-N-acetyl-D-glucosamine synthase